MKAVRIHKHGDEDVLKIDSLDTPKPNADEVLIKIGFAALNHLDIFVRRGIPGVPLPVILGSDGAGQIVETGSRVKLFKAGDKVINIPFRVPLDDPLIKKNRENLSPAYQIPGEHLDGVQAEYVVINQNFVLPKPQNLTMQEAAAFPLVFLTAYHMLVQKVHIQKEDWVLVYGASSGVGGAAIQIAKAFGATVITTVGSEEKRSMAKNLGADYIINYKENSVGKMVREISNGGVDIVFEHTGEQTWKDSLRSLKTGGKIVTCGATTGPIVTVDLRSLFIKQQELLGSTMGTMQDMTEVCLLIEQNDLKPVIAKVFEFNDIKTAHAFLDSGKHFGKVLLSF